jgi:hypothetical protein
VIALSRESYLVFLPTRLTLPLTRVCTGFNALRASWAVAPESFDAATTEADAVSPTSFDWRSTDSAALRLALIDISAADADSDTPSYVRHRTDTLPP